jgi:putative inorganic carbon (HCO3(-)) transporter
VDGIFRLGRLQRDALPAWVIPAGLALAGVVWGLLLGRLSLLNCLLLTTLAFTLVASVWEPLVGVGTALFLGPLWAWLHMELPQIPALIGQTVFLLTAGIWVVRGLLHRDLYIPLPPLLLPLLSFMGVVLLSLWRPADLWVGFLEWGKWGQIALLFLLVYERLRGTEGRRRVVATVALLAGVAVFQAGVGLWQFALRGDGPEHFAIDARFFRAYGTFEQPNPYAGFLGMLGALMAGLALTSAWDFIANYKSQIANHASRIVHHVLRFTLLSAIPTALVAVALVASWSRGGWMGFAAAIFVIAILLPRRGGWGLALALVIVVGGIGLYATGWLPASITSRLTGFLEYTRFEDVRGVGINDANYAVIERMAHWQAALSMWRERFWLGVGFGCYEAAYPAHRLINWPFALGHAHNYYLNLLAETGILGLGAYLTLLGSIFVRLWRASRRTTGWARGLALGLVGAWTHFTVHNFVDNILVNNVHLHLAVLLALSAWVIGQRRVQ